MLRGRRIVGGRGPRINKTCLNTVATARGLNPFFLPGRPRKTRWDWVYFMFVLVSAVEMLSPWSNFKKSSGSTRLSFCRRSACAWQPGLLVYVETGRKCYSFLSKTAQFRLESDVRTTVSALDHILRVPRARFQQNQVRRLRFDLEK